MAVPLLSFTSRPSPDARRGEENNKGFFLRTDNLSPRCLPDYTTVLFLLILILHWSDDFVLALFSAVLRLLHF